jgi:predicted nucleic acid-binding protein
MAMIARHLIDTSAEARMTHPEIAARLAQLIEAGLIATTAQLDAEALYSAQNAADYEQLWSDRRLAYKYLPTNDEYWQTALDAQRRLASTGRHRAIGMADLLIATLATAHDVTVLHYDADFEIAAEVLPFQHQWVLEQGTI